MWICFVQSLYAVEKKPDQVSISELLAAGFPPHLAAAWKEKAKQPPENFLKWKKSLQGKDAALVSKVWKQKQITLYTNKQTFIGKDTFKSQSPTKTNQKFANESQTKNIKKDLPLSNTTDLLYELFFGMSYQNLDVRYLPREEKNHSSLFLGGRAKGQIWILEKRDENFSYGTNLTFQQFRFTSGNRYKPIPHFYFAKDPNFYSQLERTGSPLPQPILFSNFLGYRLLYDSKEYEFGIYHAATFSSHPGLYFVSPNKSYSGVWSSGDNKSSLYINESWNSKDWGSHRIQSESIFNKKESVGFVYLKSESPESKFFLDATVYRDSPLLYGMVSPEEVRPQIPQSLGYSRMSFQHLVGSEFLSSTEGHRYENGRSGFFPFFVSEWGNLIYRYREYNESGNFQWNEIGRAAFYEWRKEKAVVAFGFESRENGGQWEGKLAIPIGTGNLLELSGIFREGQPKTRAWFENWTYATDFNINLTDRQEIIKLKWVSPFISLNVSYSEKENDPNPILFINFQLLQKFDF
ncbi:hypothetical protein EHQ68_00165 [Leptospira congkakensis]|uniref:Uncharacterized protein n=1 Tax=Leptospira congkakensis TaxID=2484932 RepID=A0A4Z1A922_9LEPT|nr:hypothetical protein [Leptospira congkakensis]TGL87815.1 hypothetical protein EHQ69_17100 [Leptospira congkakensis]TGL92592.1 hypothetical protein EHQ68_00165 [Leptospira congkakensis]TGL95966.1 hypothetical protein EHQ70_12770 [Leptospira congkakensis]